MNGSTWVVVADGERARIFEAQGAAGPLVEIACLVHEETRAAERELASDKPGRIAGGQGQGAHGLEEPHHFKAREAERFARQVSAHLEAAAREDCYQHLVVCAAPRFLGHLRRVLPRLVQGRLSREIHKDLAHIADPAALRAHLPDRL